MTSRHEEPLYVISIAARMVGVQAHTLRHYERAGLIQPSRSEGNRRYYSELDLERIRRIKTLMEDMGINLAGAEVALRLMDRISEMEQQLEAMALEVQHFRAIGQHPALKEGRSGSARGEPSLP